jgi:hypothetical protein
MAHRSLQREHPRPRATARAIYQPSARASARAFGPRRNTRHRAVLRHRWLICAASVVYLAHVLVAPDSAFGAMSAALRSSKTAGGRLPLGSQR